MAMHSSCPDVVCLLCISRPRSVLRKGSKLKKWFALLIIFCIAPCASAGPLEDLFQAQLKNEKPEACGSRSNEEVNSSDHGIVEIGLERTRCYGACPAYSVIIKEDGRFEYEGFSYVKRKGKYTGAVNRFALNQLFQFIRDVDYMSLGESYSRDITDQATTYTCVVMKEKRKVIRNYANAGPTKLWAVEQLIDKLILSASWDK